MFISVAKALAIIKHGRPLILIDHEARENEGDFFLPAQKAAPALINLFLNHGRGLLNVALAPARAAALDIWPMLPRGQNTEKTQVNFAVSVDAKKGISTGASVFDRVKTIKLLGSPKAAADDFTRPGHVFPLIAHAQGLNARAGHTEAAAALSGMGGFTPAGVLCEILDPGGRMARLPYLKTLSEKFNIPIVKISDLVNPARKPMVALNHRRFSTSFTLPMTSSAAFSNGVKAAKPVRSKAAAFDPQNLIAQIAEANLPTAFGQFKIFAFRSLSDNLEHAGLYLPGKQSQIPLVRVHSQCLTGDSLFSFRCDCGEQLKKSLGLISGHGRGTLIYLNQEGRGIGLLNKIKAYALQDKGLDTVQANCALGLPADARDFAPAAGILRKLNMTEIKLLTNNPQKVRQLRGYGIKVTARLPLEIPARKENAAYLAVKKQKFGHFLKLAD